MEVASMVTSMAVLAGSAASYWTGALSLANAPRTIEIPLWRTQTAPLSGQRQSARFPFEQPLNGQGGSHKSNPDSIHYEFS